MTSNDSRDADHPADFDTHEERWFSEPRRPSRRPSQPAPSMPPRLDDSIADGWFFDVR
jgi:hypothetical protein